jgi:hypothetical protein
VSSSVAMRFVVVVSYVFASFVVACQPNLAVPADTNITCENNNECPSSEWRCVAGRCLFLDAQKPQASFVSVGSAQRALNQVSFAANIATASANDVQLTLEFATRCLASGAFTEWRPATVAEETRLLNRDLGATKSFTWQAALDATDGSGLAVSPLDLDGDGAPESPTLRYCAEVKLRLAAATVSATSTPFEFVESPIFSLGNDAPSDAGLSVAEGRARATAALLLAPVDSAADAVELLVVEYSSAGDFVADTISVPVDSTHFPFGLGGFIGSSADGSATTTLGWRSDLLAVSDSNTARLRVTLRDALGAYATRLLSAPFIYDNTNSPPRLQKESTLPPSADASQGAVCASSDETCLVEAETVSVSFRLEDDDGDSPSIAVRVFDGSIWQQALTSSAQTSLSTTDSHVFVWQATQLGLGVFENVQLELTASDGKALSTPVLIGPFRIDTRPSGPPILLDVQAGGDVALDGAQRVPISFSIADVASDPVDVTLEYLTEAGWRPINVYPSFGSSRLDNLATRPLDASPPGIRHQVIWDVTGLTRPNNLRVRVTARDLREGKTSSVEVSALENVRTSGGFNSNGVGFFDFCRAPVAGRLDNNASDDLVWVQSEFGNSIGVALFPPGAATVPNIVVGAFASSGEVGQLAIADKSGDGINDIVALTRPPSNVRLEVFVGNGAGGFAKTANSSVDTPGAEGFALADFNGDLVADVALRVGAHAVVILTQPGANMTGPQVLYGPVGGGYSMLAHDWNADSKIDLMISDNSKVRVLIGAGDGSFTGIDDNLPLALREMHLADVNLDGLADLVAQDRLIPDITHIALGLDTGGFSLTDAVSTVTSTDLAAADFSGDGQVDLMFNGLISPPDYSSFPMRLVMSGAGTYGAAESVRTVAALGIAVGDFNADGRADFAAGQPPTDGCLAAYLSPVEPGVFGSVRPLNTSGSLDSSRGVQQARIAAGVSKTLVASSVVVGDFNTDGAPDLAVLDATNRSVSLLSGEPGVDVASGDFTLPASPAHVLSGAGSLNFSKRAMVRTDCNHDGRDDLVIAANGQVFVLRANGNASVSDGTFTQSVVLVPALNTSGSTWLLADVRAGDTSPGSDGFDDLIVASSTTLSVLTAGQDCSFSSPSQITLSGFASAPGLQSADFDHDGETDLLLHGNALTVLFSGDLPLVPVPSNVSVAAVGTADIDGNGDADIIATGSGLARSRRLTGLRTFEALPVITNQVSGSGTLSFVDVNGDAARDLILSNGTPSVGGSLLVAMAATTGGLASGLVENAAGQTPEAFSTTLDTTSSLVTDINKDGMPDFVGWERGVGRVATYLTQGGSSLSTSNKISVNAAFASQPAIAVNRAWTDGPSANDRLAFGTERQPTPPPAGYIPLSRPYRTSGDLRLVRQAERDRMGPRLRVERALGESGPSGARSGLSLQGATSAQLGVVVNLPIVAARAVGDVRALGDVDPNVRVRLIRRDLLRASALTCLPGVTLPVEGTSCSAAPPSCDPGGGDAGASEELPRIARCVNGIVVYGDVFAEQLSAENLVESADLNTGTGRRFVVKNPVNGRRVVQVLTDALGEVQAFIRRD